LETRDCSGGIEYSICTGRQVQALDVGFYISDSGPSLSGYNWKIEACFRTATQVWPLERVGTNLQVRNSDPAFIRNGVGAGISVRLYAGIQP